MINWLINNMSNEWAKYIKTGIDGYRDQVVPEIDSGFFEVAGMEIGNSIILLEEGLRNMPSIGATKLYTDGLLARFRLLNKYCLEEGIGKEEKEGKVRDAMARVEERINLVEIGVNSVLKTD